MNANKSIQPKTSAQVRQELLARGDSIAAFARRNAINVATVQQVLNGRNKGNRGEAHRAAVLLGMKIGTIDSSASSARR